MIWYLYSIKLWVIYRFVTGFCVPIVYTVYMVLCIVSLFNCFFCCILKGIKWYPIEMIWYLYGAKIKSYGIYMVPK